MNKWQAAIFAIVLAVGGVAAHAQNATVTVTVNGAPVSFDQPPIERAGRVYVPLRGVFERLGASVVFANGQINATRGSTTVQLNIGSPTATVNGQQEQLDSPPFVVGARTLVPLRFIAQALGALVNFDNSSNTVVITQPAAAQPPVVITPVPTAPPPTIVEWTLVRIEPRPDSVVDGLRPELSATFPGPAQPDSVRVRLDDRDVTADTYISGRSFVFNPTYDLPPGPHRMVVTARGAGGQQYRAAWSFTTRAVPAPNYLRALAPANGSHVGNRFVVRGVTRPGSRVHLIATANAEMPFGEVATASAIADVIAAPDGSFARELFVPEAGEIVDVRITSIAPSGAQAVATLRLRP